MAWRSRERYMSCLGELTLVGRRHRPPANDPARRAPFPEQRPTVSTFSARIRSCSFSFYRNHTHASAQGHAEVILRTFVVFFLLLFDKMTKCFWCTFSVLFWYRGIYLQGQSSSKTFILVKYFQNLYFHNRNVPFCLELHFLLLQHFRMWQLMISDRFALSLLFFLLKDSLKIGSSTTYYKMMITVIKFSTSQIKLNGIKQSYRLASSSKCRISDDCCCKNVLLKL